MISIEIMLVMVFTLMVGVMYMMFRYFDDLTCGLQSNIAYNEENGRFGLNCEKEVLNKRIDLLEQKLKDGLQGNAICCKSAIDRINSRLSSLDNATNKRTKKDEGSITVVMPNFKDKSNGK